MCLITMAELLTTLRRLQVKPDSILRTQDFLLEARALELAGGYSPAILHSRPVPHLCQYISRRSRALHLGLGDRPMILNAGSFQRASRDSIRPALANTCVGVGPHDDIRDKLRGWTLSLTRKPEGTTPVPVAAAKNTSIVVLGIPSLPFPAQRCLTLHGAGSATPRTTSLGNCRGF
jgi:hypothetical protein